MIIWLASYPRSGNTMTRKLLEQVFNLPSLSIYNEKSRGNYPLSRPGQPPSNEFDEFYPVARDSELGFIVKTHAPPIDDGPAIHITRDGRSSIVSYSHFVKDIHGKPRSKRDIIKGRVGMGSWSAMLDSWDPLNRPHTLLLRYEDVLQSPDRCIELLSQFLQLEPSGPWENNFTAMHQKKPLFFRSGSNAKNIAELSWWDTRLFWKRHGEWMKKLGYDKREYSFQSAITSLPEKMPSLWYHDPEPGMSVPNAA